MSQTFTSAILGGMMAATAASPVELIMIQQQKHGGTFLGTPIRIVKEYGVGLNGVFRGVLPTMARDGIYVAGMLGITPLVQEYCETTMRMSPVSSSLVASVIGGVCGAVFSQPVDVLKTCMQGDIERKKYGNLMPSAAQVWSEGGLRRIFNGCFWRTVNIVGTVYIANECRNRLPPYLFPGASR